MTDSQNQEKLDESLASLLDEIRLPEAPPSGARKRIWKGVAVGSGVGVGLTAAKAFAQEARKNGAALATPAKAASVGAAAASTAAVKGASVALSVKAAAVAGAVIFAAGIGTGRLVTDRSNGPEATQNGVTESETASARAGQAAAAIERPAELAESVTAPKQLAPNNAEQRPVAAPEAKTKNFDLKASPDKPVSVAEQANDVDRRRERLLLKQAQAALTRGRPADAANALQKHKRIFPKSAFAEERDYLSIRVLSESGQKRRASIRASKFLERYPRSLYRTRIESLISD